MVNLICGLNLTNYQWSKGFGKFSELLPFEVVRELFDSGATVMHFVLTRILKSFSGKLTTIQYRIAEDINQRIIDENTNIYDMLQKYAVEIASVGASKTHVNMTKMMTPGMMARFAPIVIRNIIQLTSVGRSRRILVWKPEPVIRVDKKDILNQIAQTNLLNRAGLQMSIMWLNLQLI